ncbi:MAG: DNA-directed RNA polymerase subunit beta [SAR202 cluster bacterium Casp-Chloro-G4]|nr:DNA-directed RNA polymerase subunit beta [Chloroflexota bacterium]MDA1227311.1 DNA-directed RNA polymerase subunit beta [Chloroflexota bacterium]PKB61150.1 MAG: DNA-directed RNA polymerase subunit beta [SAR202 cluster bacterium Casp-Chloro-G4]
MASAKQVVKFPAIRTLVPRRQSYAKLPSILDVPNLIQVQLDSFNWFKTEGLRELFDEISPIEDFAGGRFELTFENHYFEQPKYTEQECREKEVTFSAPLHVTVKLKINAAGPGQGEVKEQTLFIGDIPMMTINGTFVINGAERVVVSQLVRSPGVYFTVDSDANTGRRLSSAKLIPYRGAWMEFETSNRDVLSVKVDRKRKTPVSTLLRSIGFATDEELLGLFADVDTNPDHQYMKTTIEKDSAVTNEEDALLEFYRRLRPGEPPSVDNAKNLLDNLFFNERRYDLGRVGRYKLNRRLDRDTPATTRILEAEDLVTLMKVMIQINNGDAHADDIDHLANRRVRAVGELIQNQVRVGLLRMERVIKERMTTQMDPATTTPAALINIRPVVAAVREFFGGSQLSQFMDQTNPLAELTHKRRLSALGPGGLSRERAGFDVRDVHHSHYGRICPIETPEGPNIGLLGSLATYARTNEYGFIETPYRKVFKEIESDSSRLEGRTLTQDILDETGKTILKNGSTISRRYVNRVMKLPKQTLTVKPYVSPDPADIEYLSADAEEKVHIAQANSPVQAGGEFLGERVETRKGDLVGVEFTDNVEYMDVSPMQLVSVSTSLIPFLEHDDANRALMGSNMQRQAVPLLKPQPPLVGTGMEGRVARDSGQVVISRTAGVVTESTSEEIVVTDAEGESITYKLLKFLRSNQGTCINQRSIVRRGDVVKGGDVLADSSSTGQGELALGQNVLVAFMSWEGYNFEDAIILSEKLVKDDRFTSIHIERHEVEARDTKLGPEEITRDIPNVGEDSLRDLDEDGIIRVGAEIGPGDILVGKITPKGETELSAEEKLLRAIFGEKARDVKDTSLRVPHGERGRIIGVKVLTRANKAELPPGVNKMVRLWIAQTRKITEGDKMAGRHGNKGVIAKIMPEEDMPFLPDGTPVDIILNPIGVPSRMNLGQVLETHLGWAAHNMGFRAVTPVFDGAPDVAIEDALAQAWIVEKSGAIDPRSAAGVKEINIRVVREWLADRGRSFSSIFTKPVAGEATKACHAIWLKEDMGRDTSGMTVAEIREEVLRLNREQQISAPTTGKSILYDGRTGEAYDQPIAVGMIYMLKLIHLVEDKIHARSTGPYSLITQQPLGGKAQFGGQRFGEMEVWALEAYSAAYNLQEMLTVKSDDVVGRVKTYEAIVKGEDVIQPGIPESFHVLLKELQSLGLSVELLHEEAQHLDLDEIDEDVYQNGETMLEAVPSLDFVEDTFPPVVAPVDVIPTSQSVIADDVSEDE